MEDVVIIGCGAAGMMAGIHLAQMGYHPVIFEKNDRAGKKLFITGKGRCNLTNNCPKDELFGNIVTNPKFMYSAINSFDSEATMDFFEQLGLPLKTERGNRVFPASDHSSDVIRVLTDALKNNNVSIHYKTEVLDILTEGEEEKHVIGLVVKKENGAKETIKCNRIVVATGGLSYPLTGSTGDGYRWAKELGLSVIAPYPALVPMEIAEPVCKELMGLSLKNVSVAFETVVKNKKKVLYSGFGEMLFTHFGVSGPLILSASSYLNKYLDEGIILSIDLKPALSEEQLEQRLLRDFGESKNKQIRNAISDLLPKSMLPVILERSGIDPYKKVNEVTKAERMELIHCLKHFTLTVSGFRGFDEAIITQGGVSVKEIDPRNMNAKKVGGLQFIGEVLDVDALTGGFNLQVAWSTARMLE